MLVLRLDHALQEAVDQEVATFASHVPIFAVDRDLPERLNSKELLEVIDVDYLERVGLLVVIDVAVFGIHVQEEHAEAAEPI